MPAKALPTFKPDTRTGQAAYAVLSFGGFLGIGEKLFAVPWQARQLDTVNKRYILNKQRRRRQRHQASLT